jgi:L-noviosyl transferase
MRILFTANPAPSHLFAMVPLAWSLHLAGHHVVVAAPQALAQQVRRAGLTTAVAGGDATFLNCWPAGRPLGGSTELDLEVFAAIAERTAPDVLDLARTWRPDLIVADPVEYAGPIAATRIGVPWVRHEWGLPVPDATLRIAHARIADRLGRLGPTPDPAAAIVDTCPPSLRTQPADDRVLAMRYVPYNGACTAPDWLFAPPDRPRVCVSMGTAPIPEGVHGLAAAVRGLAELDVEVIVSGAGAHDVADLPPNVRRIGWIPHHHLLPSCSLFVHHGGSNSAMAALVAGRPHLVMPQMCDQFEIGERLVRAGVARCVPFAGRGPDAVRDAARVLLTDPAYPIRAAGLRDEIAVMPSPAEVAAALTGPRIPARSDIPVQSDAVTVQRPTSRYSES